MSNYQAISQDLARVIGYIHADQIDEAEQKRITRETLEAFDQYVSPGWLKYRLNQAMVIWQRCIMRPQAQKPHFSYYLKVHQSAYSLFALTSGHPPAHCLCIPMNGKSPLIASLHEGNECWHWRKPTAISAHCHYLQMAHPAPIFPVTNSSY